MSTYRSGTSLRWLKTKSYGEGEFQIIGLARDAKALPIGLLARGELPDLRFPGASSRLRTDH